MVDKKNNKSFEVRKYVSNMYFYNVLRYMKYDLIRKKIRNIKDEDMRFYLNSIYN